MLGARVWLPRHDQQGKGCKPKKDNLRSIRRPSLLEWFFLSLSLSLSLESCIKVPSPCILYLSYTLLGPRSLGMTLYIFIFPVPCWAIPLEHWQCLLYFLSIVHDVCMYIYMPICGWSCTLYDGISWLCERPSLVMSAFDLVVWGCAQGNFYRCMLMLYCVHDYCGVIVLIHVI